MAALSPPRLYRETRLNLDPAFANSTISITLPSPSSGRQQSHRQIASHSPSDLNEASFAQSHLAQRASLYFRKKNAFPRSFLWRVLQDDRVLELQAVDLTQDLRNRDEAQLTLQIRFPAPIRPFSIAFAEPEEKDALCVFVVTGNGRELWTLTLNRSAWVKENALDGDDWWKVYKPSTWVARTVYRLVASGSRTLLASVDNGGLVRLERKAGESGAVWHETIFMEGRWGTLRGIVPWKGHTVRFGTDDLAPSTAADMVMTPDGTHLATVGLDHTLRLWNLQTGKVGVQTDLAGHNDKDTQRAMQYTIAATQKQLIKVLEVDTPRDGELYYIVTYSPRTHEFKFWSILDPDTPGLGIRDLHQGIELVPPVDELMDTTVWNMEEFHISPSKGWKESKLWIRVRSGPNSKVYVLNFDLFGDLESETRRIWREDWVTVDEGSLAVEALRHATGHPTEPDPYDPYMHAPSSTEEWLGFLFYPGRFTIPTLETALQVYQRGLGQITGQKRAATGATISGDTPLKERICHAVTSKVPVPRNAAESPNYDRYELDIGSQWQVFYGLVKDLHRRRSEALSFAFDHDTGLPWVIRADCVCAVRSCSEPEVLTLNQDLLTGSREPVVTSPLSHTLQHKDSVQIARFLNAARIFRSVLPQPFQHSLRAAVKVEILQDPSYSINDRIRLFDDRCELSYQVTDEDLAQLNDALSEVCSLNELTTAFFEAALSRLDEPQRGHSQHTDLTRFGARSLFRGAHETLELGSTILLDLLVLLVFAVGELDSNEEACHFDRAAIFNELISRLRDHEVLLWLASVTRQEAATSEQDSDSLHASTSSVPASQPPTTMTLLESIFIGDWASMKFPNGPLCNLMTYWTRAWTFRASLNKPYEDVMTHILSNLLKHGDTAVANDFKSFVPSTPWGAYLKARLALELGDYEAAAAGFKKSAEGLSMGFFDVSQHDYTDLLNIDEREYFSDGMARFHQHVVSLFEKTAAYSYAADFAEAGLLALSAAPESEDTQTIYSELLSRLFQASLKTSQYSAAYTALVRHTDPALRKSNLQQFIRTLSTSSSLTLLTNTLPTLTLASEIDASLAALARSTLNVTSPTTPPYHKILYAFRVARGDFRGAAEVLWERLQRLKEAGSSTWTGQAGADVEDDEVLSTCLLLINCLSVVGEGQGWIVADWREEEPARKSKKSSVDKKSFGGLAGVGKIKRGVITLEDVRRVYQEELDARDRIEMGRVAFWGEDEDAMVL